MGYFAPGLGAQANPYRPQGFWDDVSSAVNTIAPIAVPIITSLLAAGPPQSLQQQGGLQQGQGFRAQGTGLPLQQQQGAMYRPQGFWDDVSSAVNTIAPIAVPIITSLLAAGPPQNLQQGFRTQGAGMPMQQQGGMYRPQGFWDDISSAVNTIAPIAVPIITSLLAAGPPQTAQGFRAQAAGLPMQGLGYQPQSFWDDISNVTRVVVPIVTSLLAAGPPAMQGGAQTTNPQVNAALQTLLASLQQGQQQGTVQQQPQTVAAGAR
jgi:hypothetical protein